MADLEFPTEGLELLASGMAPLTSAEAKAAAPEESSLEFDLGDLSLDLTTNPAPLHTPGPKASAPAPAPVAASEETGDPLDTKLALAEEFHAIGDSDGARTLIEEVIAEASGPVKARAQRLLADIG